MDLPSLFSRRLCRLSPVEQAPSLSRLLHTSQSMRPSHKATLWHSAQRTRAATNG